MSETVNKKIKDKIKGSEIDDPIKKFLLDILHLEYNHHEENSWKYGKDYERLIKKYAKERGD